MRCAAIREWRATNPAWRRRLSLARPSGYSASSSCLSQPNHSAIPFLYEDHGMIKTRIAAIDIGTNSIRCIVAEAVKGGRFKVLDDEKVTVRLGENLQKTGL